MELLLNSAHVESVENAIDTFPITGITTCASVMEKEGQVDFFPHLQKLRGIIGSRSIHVQVVSTTYAGIIAETDKIRDKLGRDTYIRIPATRDGMKAIKELSHEGVNVTAACILSPIQGLLAAMAGADYLLCEYQRMEEAGINASSMLARLSKILGRDDEIYSRILAVGFHSIDQVVTACESGADAVSVDPSLLASSLDLPVVDKVTNSCKTSWRNIHGDKTLLDL